MLRKVSILTLLAGVLVMLGMNALHAQQPVAKAEEGWHINPYGRIHILFLFVEIDFDSSWAKLDPEKNPEGSAGWKKGRLPFWRDKLISPTPDGDGFMTRYFSQASFGKFEVTGDYFDEIISIPLSSIRDNRGNVVTQEPFANNHYRRTIIEYVNTRPQKFKWGSSLQDFDRWGYKGQGQPNTPQPNGKIDMVMLVFRNIHVAYLADAAGFVSPGSIGKLWGVDSDMMSIFHAQNQSPKVVMRHEFSHMLYGGNNFHTAGGGVGTRTFMSTIGGWSNMSAADACSPTWNAWDRERLGWKNPENAFLVNAQCFNSGAAVNGELAYGQPFCGDGLVLLRDFVSTGDAIKIPLPHMPAGTMKQYLWLEYHRNLPGNIDHDRAMVPGLYAFIQAGKDEREGQSVFGGENNYIWPMVAAGQFDFMRDPKTDGAIQDRTLENPLTGYHYLMRHTMDLNDDGLISILPDNGPKTEYYMPKDLTIDGRRPPDSMFTFERYPIFGMRTVAFQPGDRIGIGTNPSATPVYTHSGSVPRPNDNRRIYLNGIRIEVVREVEGEDGAILLQIKWDDFVVNEWRRWCGNIVLTESLELRGGGEIHLTQGLSAQVPKAVQKWDGKHVFAEPTLLEVLPGATLDLGARTRLVVEKGSSLLIRKGANVVAARTGQIVVEDGAYIYIEEGAVLPASFFSRNLDISPQAIKAVNPLIENGLKPILPKLRAL